ncbi:uracil-DNA glycosylase family protein [Roseomonas genomospecies 6]|uniref:Uracil-DNA glycosylase family protein n=1 Tax=Roseomonas genomospecies 6 TaxID=214106 RepID=A0A9W7TZT4_9PROT|nr:uracil-DNA glycosylase family protein [Roseomonas genomospecies 6]KAA0683053.1 uracil-DNA glycosylase family protein [Roseomonas genomospecies 6]
MTDDLKDLFEQARACRLCAAVLPHGCRPVLRGSPSARLLIVGQAPGARVHATGIPWNDPSGDRLRQWLAMDRTAFYDESRIAIVPMGLCYPGTAPKGGDYPPRPECAPLWHPPLRTALTGVRLTLLVGSYAQAHYLGNRRKRTMTDTVAAWREYLPEFLPLPHPSWRNTAWLKKNPWFDAELVPALRRRVEEALDG